MLELYKTIQSSPHGHSGRGMSYWNKAALCGRFANLAEQHKDKLVQIHAAEIEEAGEDGDSRTIGTYYHALMELALRGQLENETWDQTDEALDPNFLEAVHLYRGYTAAWGSPLQRWGATLVGVELSVPSTEAGKAAVLALMGGEDTGRIDALLDIQDVDLAYANTGLLLPGPGLYLVDWKTGKSKTDRDQWEFGFGNQSINYLHIYNLEHPDAPARGMIFDKILRHKTLRKEPEYAKTGSLKANSSFHAYLAQSIPGDEKVIQGLITKGKKQVEANEANAAYCFSGAKPCAFFTLGLCNRY